MNSQRNMTLKIYHTFCGNSSPAKYPGELTTLAQAKYRGSQKARMAINDGQLLNQFVILLNLKKWREKK
jgi:lipopolysaccharide biosynthesis glycosyltransferase